MTDPAASNPSLPPVIACTPFAPTEPSEAQRPRRPRVVLIAAVARNGAIGKGNALVWRNAEDLAHLRRATLGAPVLMGRRTWDSLPERFRPLPGRRNLVLTRQAGWQSPGAEAVASFAAALALAAAEARLSVIGGAEVYRLALPCADELLLTELDAELDGDTFFPAWDRTAFTLEATEPRVDTEGTAFRFATYRRLGAP